MKQFILFALFTFFISCEKDKPFFNFDEVYMYQIPQKESSKYFGTDQRTTQKEKDEFNKIAFLSRYPKTLNDKWYFEKLEHYYPKKQKIEKSKLKELSDIFTERTKEKTVAMACEPIFRNVFIFKKNGKIVGISKICFSCQEQQTIGTKSHIENFGANDEYSRLAKLVDWRE